MIFFFFCRMSSHREVNREKQRKAIQNNEEFKLLQEQKAKRIEEEQHQRQMVKFFYYKWRKSGIHCIFNDFNCTRSFTWYWNVDGSVLRITLILWNRISFTPCFVYTELFGTLFDVDWIVSKFLCLSVAFK